MNLSRRRGREEPEINLIPLIDVLLVVIIFLMLTTTYARFGSLEINLPSTENSEQNEAKDRNEIEVDVTASGQVTVAGTQLKTPEPRFIREALEVAGKGRNDPLIVINSDAKATYQTVIDVMQAAQLAGYPRISFTTQNLPTAP
ncbi:MAG: biopolymer transporter ExbD [Zoogloeaceae bacterium]|jgi:biopolymer transport protein ExbD|nr:biopolymer transporter ExbD [Zoogloeaceae bacterium]